jgi:adenylate cyclase
MRWQFIEEAEIVQNSLTHRQHSFDRKCDNNSALSVIVANVSERIKSDSHYEFRYSLHMPETRVNRKLAAILSADVVGYSKLMADDDGATVSTLKQYRAAIDHVIERHKGRIVNAPGDNILAEFASAVEAVQGAVEIQKSIEGRNFEIADDRRMHFRVGVNLGDVIQEDDGTIYGDGVNVAARLESLAKPGGICISGAVFDQIKGRVPYSFEDIGSQQVKNIAEPVRAYRVSTEGEVVPAKRKGAKSIPRVAILGAVTALVIVVAGLTIWQNMRAPVVVETEAADPFLALPTGPSIAVLPFNNMSGDPEQEYFADGITEQIIAELARFRDLFVIARNSTFQYKDQSPDVRTVATDLGVRYVLEGSVRKATNTVRVTAQLLDGSTGSHLWAETYDADLTAENIFSIQDQIASQVVATLAGHSGVLSRTDRWQAKKSSTGNLQAYECVLLAQGFQGAPTAEAHRVLLDCLKRAVEIDPNYVDAWAWLAYIYSFGYAYGFAPGPEHLQLGLQAAQEATRLDPTNQMAHFGMAVSHYFRGEIDAFREEAETAIALNPNNTDVIAVLAEYYTYAVDWDRGVALMRKAMTLNPMHPGWYWYPVAKYHMVRGEFDEAITAARKIISPDDYITYCVLAYVSATAGRQVEAEQAAALALKAFPDASVEGVALLYKRWNFSPEYIQRYVVDGLRKAGLPETPNAK